MMSAPLLDNRSQLAQCSIENEGNYIFFGRNSDGYFTDYQLASSTNPVRVKGNFYWVRREVTDLCLKNSERLTVISTHSNKIFSNHDEVLERLASKDLAIAKEYTYQKVESSRWGEIILTHFKVIEAQERILNPICCAIL